MGIPGIRVVTAIEVLSPSNKVMPGQRAYLEKRQRFIEGGVNFVELNLLRGGGDMLLARDTALAPDKRSPCRYTVARAGQSYREVFPLPLRERLARVPVPLRPGDKDAVLDLQSLIDRVCEVGSYNWLDYSRELDPPLDAADHEWVREQRRPTDVAGF